MRRRVEIESDHIAQFWRQTGSCDSLKRRTRCGCRPCAAQIRCTQRCLIPAALAIARPVQCVVSPGGSASVNSTTRSITAAVSGGLPGGLVAHAASRQPPRP